ncbi:hypothetical protein SERLA73DRAFT_192404 [Serpula lacrymans var. lacrymans S7.3]|uniref:Uncharacterized protein n=1 Tax=Serpula lacrymans var. lacrymans (strain S7.3) TaxID=936435 RepID=F8QKB2_SERL3|nr:hypothetical protein SERLA73DRAFT_192404 [Serpula lacrymans var. lacrymans S7.3]
MRRRRVEVTEKWIRMGIQKRPSGENKKERKGPMVGLGKGRGVREMTKSKGAMQCVASGDVKICQNAKTRKVPNGKAKVSVTGLPNRGDADQPQVRKRQY